MKKALFAVAALIVVVVVALSYQALNVAAPYDAKGWARIHAAEHRP